MSPALRPCADRVWKYGYLGAPNLLNGQNLKTALPITARIGMNPM